MKIKSQNLWFSIIEVMIAIFIFAMGIASIFMVITSSMNANNLNKDQIIASNLAREQIEIIRNIRDDNYVNFRKWNYIPNSWNDYSKVFEVWKYYKIENDFSSSEYPFKIKSDWNQTFWTNWKDDIKNWKYDDYQLCIKKDSNIYSFDCLAEDKKIRFYKYLKIEKLKDNSWNTIDDTLKLISKVVWYNKWYHEFEINTILANFNRY